MKFNLRDKVEMLEDFHTQENKFCDNDGLIHWVIVILIHECVKNTHSSSIYQNFKIIFDCVLC